jgi:hypothetical protein
MPWSLFDLFDFQDLLITHSLIGKKVLNESPRNSAFFYVLKLD